MKGRGAAARVAPKVKTRVAAPRYLARGGSRFTDKDARVLGPIIARIARKHGAITSRMLLDEASAPNSPAHAYFTWDSDLAAEQWRLQEASHIIRSIAIRVEDVNDPSPPPRAFHVVSVGDGRGYVPLATVLANVDMTEQLLARARAEAVQWYHKYKQLRGMAEAAGVFEAIETLAPELRMTADAASA